VKELRLRGILSIDAGNAFLEEYMGPYNVKFGKAPKSTHDAHRHVRDDEDLDLIFSWQETRKLSKNLELHYKRGLFQLTPNDRTKRLVGQHIQVFEWENGRIELRHNGSPFPSRSTTRMPMSTKPKWCPTSGWARH